MGTDGAAADAIGVLADSDAAVACLADFCDDFEAGSIERWDSAQTIGAGTILPTTSLARTGDYSLRASSQGQGAVAFLEKDLSPYSAEVHATVHLYVPDGQAFLDTTELLTLADADPHAHLFLEGETLSINHQSGRVYSDTDIARNEWMCIQIRYIIGDSDGLAELRVNGDTVGNAVGINTTTSDGYSSFELGISFTQENQTPIEVFFDDVSVGPSATPCN